MTFSEQNYENALIDLFSNQLGYTYIHGSDLDREKTDIILKDRLIECLNIINKGVPNLALEEAIPKVFNFQSGNLLKDNKEFHKMLVEGVSVNYYENGESKADIVKLIDFENIKNNEFLIVRQYTVKEKETKRPDLVVFVNGLPLCVMELKSCSRENTNVSEGYLQIRNYLQTIPSLFVYNSFVVISDMINTKSGTITSDEDRFMEWKSVDGKEEVNNISFETLFKGMFEKERFLDIISNFILFLGNNEDKPIKILSQYHQFYAVNKAVNSTIMATSFDGKGGVFWHTQGSGKSLSMVFYTRKLLEPLKNPTIVVVTDRNDLDDQLYKTFLKAKNYLRQEPKQAESRKDLKELLNNRQAGGIIFTTIQKFEEDTEKLSERTNIVVVADEAHRSQYGLRAKVDKETGKITHGFAKYLRDALPNATFIGFTGTPIDSDDRSTKEIFGDYIDIYDMTKAVEDGATKPIYYEPRVMNLDLDKEILDKIDELYEDLEDKAEEHDIEKSKKDLANMEAILGSEDTINTLCFDILNHYNKRKNILEGKAMIVAYSRSIGIKIYKKLLEIDKTLSDKVTVVMTHSNKDPEEWFKIIGEKSKRKDIEEKFRDPKGQFKIVIVVDMWLTGFDVPCLDTMYIYKPMKGHTLMQAIARVNRVYGEKEGGLIVDYVGIASELKNAMKDFTDRDRKRFEENDISKSAYPKFKEKLSILRDIFHGFDYSSFFGSEDFKRASCIINGVNFILENEERKTTYIRESLALKQAQTLCITLLTEEEKIETAFFEAVRSSIIKINSKDKMSLKEINEAVSNLLKNSIQSKGVVKIFDENATMSIFDDKYLESLKNMKQKNLALELLKRLLKDEIKIFKRTNVIKSEAFSKRMENLMNEYNNAQISNAQIIEQLMKIIDEMKDVKNTGENMGLNADELAFYDALSTPEGVKEAFTNEEFIKMTHELCEMIRSSKTIDWKKKESARANMRRMIKRLLKKYDYPPKGEEKALEMIIKQIEFSVDEDM